jgi:MFS family permease
MLGLGLGSLLGGRIADRFGRPALLYAASELAMGVLGGASLYAFEGAGTALAGSPLAVVAAVSFGLLLAPTTLMGMTLPLMCRSIEVSDRELGRHFSKLYASNTLGAPAGALLSSYLVIGLFGLARISHGGVRIEASEW